MADDTSYQEQETAPRDFMQEPRRPFPTKKLIRWGFVGAAGLFLIALAAYYAYQEFGPTDREIAARNLSGTMEEVAARAKEGDVVGAQQLLRDQAEQAANSTERGVALLTHAQLALEQSIESGVAEHKAVADDESLPDTVRAAALVSLASYYYFDAIDADTLTSAIFTGAYADMLEQGVYQSDQEAAYAALLTKAEALEATPMANAYLARYWAHEVYRASLAGTPSSEITDNAYTYRARSQWYIDNGSEEMTAFDAGGAILRVQLGVVEAYLAAADVGEYTLAPALGRMVAAFADVSKAMDYIAAQSDTAVANKDLFKVGVEGIQHQFWVDVLSVAVEILNSDPDVAAALANAYAGYITSEDGAAEHVHAVSTDSDVAPLINTLRTVSAQLNTAAPAANEE